MSMTEARPMEPFHKRDRDGRTMAEVRSRVERAARLATDQVKLYGESLDAPVDGKARDIADGRDKNRARGL